MEKDLISVIVPVYKVEKYLEKCIESVLKQTYTNLQIILVDDGSPDNCGKICDEYAKKDSRIEVIHKANGGLSDARNVGISKAKGRYIGFVDSDDYIKEDMYEILLNLIKKYDADVSICNLYDVIDGNECIRNKENGIREYSRLDILKKVLLDKNIQSYAWNKLYEKELFDEIKYPIGKKYEDIGTTFYLFEKCNKIVVTSEPEYYYLKRADSLVNNVTESTILDYTEIIIQRYIYIKQNIKELRKYNNYYLAKTLITAHNDIENLENISEEMQQRYKKLYELVLEIIKSNSKDIDELFSEEQKSALENLIKL
jgi:glycosyltransferase involved in cell wall biosynthesis